MFAAECFAIWKPSEEKSMSAYEIREPRIKKEVPQERKNGREIR